MVLHIVCIQKLDYCNGFIQKRFLVHLVACAYCIMLLYLLYDPEYGHLSHTHLALQVVKVADFGVARVKAQSGVMTAETGTYRWMAPEVCS